MTEHRRRLLKRKLQESRYRLYKKDIDFAYPLKNIVFVATKDVRRISTNGRCIYLDPDWLQKLGKTELDFMLSHQIMHIVLGHTEFMIDNLYSLSPRDYSIYYYGINSVNDTDPDYMMVQQMHSEFFPLLCQHYITTLLYSEQGEKNQLACLVYQTRKQPIEIDKMYLGDLSVSFYNKEENYVISAKYDGIQYCVNAGGNHIPNFNLCYYISKYRNEFYYRFLGNMEMKLFERDFSELSNGRKRITYNKKFRQLITKIKSLAGHEYKYTESFDDQFAEKWEFYISNDKSDINTYFHDNTKEFKSILEENFQHLKLLTELNYSKSNWIVAVVAAVASVLATIISLITLLRP